MEHVSKEVLYKVVSSAYKSTAIGEFFNEKGRSFIKKQHKRVPKIDPCGIPQTTSPILELDFFLPFAEFCCLGTT